LLPDPAVSGDDPDMTDPDDLPEAQPGA